MAEINELQDTELLFHVLSMIAPLGLALRGDLASLVRTDEYPKKHLLLKQGQTARRIYFIKKGFARAFYYDLDGKENTCWFMGAGDVMISVLSFFTQQPASENIELLEDSVLQSVTYQELEDLYTDHPAFNYHGRKLTELYYIKSEERNTILHCRKPAERYKLLLKTHPDILQQASLKQIASYLGIELETLSRIRASRDI
jgi:CRP-like cAMP-binding protein